MPNFYAKKRVDRLENYIEEKYLLADKERFKTKVIHLFEML
jgi:hypothetical protein